MSRHECGTGFLWMCVTALDDCAMRDEKVQKNEQCSPACVNRIAASDECNRSCRICPFITTGTRPGKGSRGGGCCVARI
jgi:hypothetical protein